MFLLCSTPPLSSDPEVLALVEKFLKSLISTHSGLLYLTCKSEITRGIVRLLIGPLSLVKFSEQLFGITGFTRFASRKNSLSMIIVKNFLYNPSALKLPIIFKRYIMSMS